MATHAHGPKSNPNRGNIDSAARSKAAARLYPTIFDKYRKWRDYTHVGMFSAKKWLEVGGTQQQIDKIKAQSRKIDAKRSESIRRGPQSFVDSIENLQKIANAPEGTRRGPLGSRDKESKKPNQNESKLQKRIRIYAESRGLLVVQWDWDANPDHLYVSSHNIILGAAEIKDKGKKPRRDQAGRILELRNRMPVAVISDFETFKKWIDSRIAEAQ